MGGPKLNKWEWGVPHFVKTMEQQGYMVTDAQPIDPIDCVYCCLERQQINAVTT